MCVAAVVVVFVLRSRRPVIWWERERGSTLEKERETIYLLLPVIFRHWRVQHFQPSVVFFLFLFFGYPERVHNSRVYESLVLRHLAPFNLLFSFCSSLSFSSVLPHPLSLLCSAWWSDFHGCQLLFLSLFCVYVDAAVNTRTVFSSGTNDHAVITSYYLRSRGMLCACCVALCCVARSQSYPILIGVRSVIDAPTQPPKATTRARQNNECAERANWASQNEPLRFQVVVETIFHGGKRKETDTHFFSWRVGQLPLLPTSCQFNIPACCFAPNQNWAFKTVCLYLIYCIL